MKTWTCRRPLFQENHSPGPFGYVNIKLRPQLEKKALETAVVLGTEMLCVITEHILDTYSTPSIH